MVAVGTAQSCSIGNGGSGSDGGDGYRKTQGMAAAELDSGRGCTGSFRARLGRGEYEVACWPTPSPVYINL